MTGLALLLLLCCLFFDLLFCRIDARAAEGAEGGREYIVMLCFVFIYFILLVFTFFFFYSCFMVGFVFFHLLFHPLP